MNNSHNISSSLSDWKPKIFDLKSALDWQALEQLRFERLVWQTVDSIEVQLRQLVSSRSPNKKMDASQISAKCLEITHEADIEQFGCWVYYSWSGQLVHVLPLPLFCELRLNRNRNKITQPEQERLARLTIGVIGLSAGNAAALTLALEGIGGKFKLADFDHLDLSNMNRLRTSVHDLSLPKTVITARQIFEINPFIEIELFHQGVTADNVEEFLIGTARLDLVIEECDSIDMKFLVRQRARDHQIPLLMETGDRGMLDVERFDLEPTRPLFHGRIADQDWQGINRISQEEKIRLGLQIVGVESISPGLGASMVEIGRTLTTWPQLAGEVALGGALIATSVRAMFCGQALRSGRYYADLDQILGLSESDNNTSAMRGATPVKLIEDAHIQYIIEHAAMAPSGGNMQPWQFHTDNASIWISPHPNRAKTLLDVGMRAAHLAIGAAAENGIIAANSLGYHADVKLSPCQDGFAVCASISFEKGYDHIDDARKRLHWVRQRSTNRHLAERIALTQSQESALLQSVATAPAPVHLHLLKDEAAIVMVAEIIGAAERLRLLNPHLHRQAMAEMRWTSDEVRQTRDGIDIETLEPTPSDRVALQLLRRPDVVQRLHQWDTGSGIQTWFGKPISCASAVALFVLEGAELEDYIGGGRALPRLWLKATELGLALHPTTALLYMLQMLDIPELAKTFTDNEQAQLLDLERQLDQSFGAIMRNRRALLFRIAVAPPPTVRSLRLPVDKIFAL